MGEGGGRPVDWTALDWTGLELPKRYVSGNPYVFSGYRRCNISSLRGAGGWPIYQKIILVQ